MPHLLFSVTAKADKDPVIQIANVVKVQGGDELVAKNVFTLLGCAPIVDAHVITNKTEEGLLCEVSPKLGVRCLLLIRSTESCS